MKKANDKIVYIFMKRRNRFINRQKFALDGSMQKRKGKLLIVSEKYNPSLSTDSILMTQLSEDLFSMDRDVTVLTSRLIETKKRLPAQENIHGVHVKRMRCLRIPGNSTIIKILNRIFLMISSFFYIPFLRHFDIVMCVSTPPLFPLIGAIGEVLFHNKFVFLLYDLYPEVAELMGLTKHNSVAYRFLNILYLYVFKHADRVICLGRDIQKYLISVKKVPLDKTVIITNWADAENVVLENPDHMFRKRNGIENKFLVTYSGNLGLFHDFDTLIEAAQSFQLMKNDHIVFAIVGRGDQKARVVSKVGEAGLKNIIFEDFLPADEHYDLLASSDVLLTTLKPGVENCSVPSKTYPYIVSGKPVIAIMNAESEIAQTIREEKAGYVIEPGQAELLVDTLEVMMQDPKLMQTISHNAKDAGKRRFTRSIVIPMYEKLFQSLE